MRCWRHYIPILARMRVLTEADGLILANLCLNHSYLVLLIAKANELNKKSESGLAGIIVPTDSGGLTVNQVYAQMQKCMEKELKFCRELGLSPSARSRIHAGRPGEDLASDRSDLLNGRWRRTRPLPVKPAGSPAVLMPGITETVN